MIEHFDSLGLTILDSIDLADLNQDNGSIFNFLQKNYKPVFLPNERLVLYTEYCPSQDLLDYIQLAATTIDVSNCFIAIVSKHDLKTMVIEANKKYGNDESVFETHCVDNIKSKPLNEDSFKKVKNNVCAFPWMNLSLSNNGHWRPCCSFKGSMGTTSETEILTAFDNQSMLRDRFLSGEYLNECSHCWTLEKNGITSLRQHNLQLNKKIFYSELLDKPTLKTMDLRITNICNFKCRICSPSSSSQVAAEQLRITTNQEEKQKIKDIIEQSNWSESNPDFLDDIVHNLDNIINLDFYGGEPFLVPRIKDFLQQIVDLGLHKQIRLHFNTNGSIFDKNIVDLLTQFKEVDIAFSIDDIKQRFEYQRGGSWSQVENNIKNYLEYSGNNFTFSIYPTINIQNVFYLDELVNWTHSLKLPIHYNVLDTPEFLSIENMTEEAKHLVINKLENHNEVSIRGIVDIIKSSTAKNNKGFVEYMSKLDKTRKTNFSDNHPEMSHAMGYSV